MPSKSTPSPRARDRRVHPGEDELADELVAESDRASPETPTATPAPTGPEAATGSEYVPTSDAAPTSEAAADASVGVGVGAGAGAEPDHDRSSALLAAGLGLLGIGGAAGLAGSSSGSAPPIAVTPPPVVVVDPPKPDQPKSDPSGSEHTPDPGSTKPTPPAPDQSKPDQPKPEQPQPDQPKPDQPQQPDPGKTDPNPPANPDPKPAAHVPFAPTLSLQKDTGSSDHDLVSSSGAVNVSGLEAGATLAISLDGGQTWRSHSGDVLPESLFGADGAKHLLVKQIDANGNLGNVAELSFQLDRTAPDALHWAMPAGKSALGVSDVIALQGAEAGALVEYRLDANAPWLAATDGRIPVSQFHKDGTEHFEVRQTDLAGNVGLTTSLVAAVDVTAPAVPTLALANDTGVSGTDAITQSGAIRVTGVEPGAELIARASDSDVWHEFPAGTTVLDFGLNDGNGQGTATVKQIDAAGNVSGEATLTYTLLNQVRLPSFTTTGKQTSDDVLLNGHDSLATELSGYWFERGGVLDYRIDGGGWSATADGGKLLSSAFGADGKHNLELRQTDLAGNVGTRLVEVMLDSKAPTISLSLKNDDGVSSTDKITTDPAVVVDGLQAGDSFTFRVNGGDWNKGWDWLANTGPVIKPAIRDVDAMGHEGTNTLEVYATDAAGNVGVTSQLTFNYLKSQDHHVI